MNSGGNKKLATNSSEITSDDLLLEILLRLPLYSIQRLKTTCKQWLALIINPTFRKLWRKRNLKLPTGLLFNRGSSSTYFVPLYPNNIPTTIPSLRTNLRILQSCNGLLLCTDTYDYYDSNDVFDVSNYDDVFDVSNYDFNRVFYYDSDRVFEYHVYNPTTDTCHTLPKLSEKLASKHIIEAMSLAFDPNRSLYYKVISFVKFDNKVLRVYIYSSDTRTWKLVSKPFCGEINSPGVYWNGAIHWMKTSQYFNIKNEGFKEMPKPPNTGAMRKRYYFGESCDRLNYVPLLKDKLGDSCSVQVYELKRDYSEWVLKYHVDLDYVLKSIFTFSVVHGVHEDDMFLVLGTRKGIVRHNIVSETSEMLPVSYGVKYLLRAFQYIITSSRLDDKIYVFLLERYVPIFVGYE